MWTLSKVLANIEDHVPNGFNAQNGIRSLFPSGYSGSIEPLSGYVFSNYFRTTSLDASGNPCNSDLWVMADGTGRWFFGWVYGQSQANGYRFAGFVFHPFSSDGRYYGYIDDGFPTYGDGVPEEVTLCNSGTSAIIAENWPAMFKAGVSINFWIFAPSAIVDRRIVWRVGKTPIVFLDGLNVPPEPGSGQSGSLLFPLPSIGPDVYVAGLAAAWHTKFIILSPSVPPVSAQRIRSFIDTPNFISPAKASILSFLATSAADDVISNAMLVAEQTRKMAALAPLDGGLVLTPTAPLPTLGEPGGLSIEVTASQIIAAGTAAFQVNAAPSIVVPYNFIETLVTNVLAQPPIGSSPQLPTSSGGSIVDTINELLDLISRALAGNLATGVGEADGLAKDLLQELGAWLLSGLTDLTQEWSPTVPDPYQSNDMGAADAAAAARQVNLPDQDGKLSSPAPPPEISPPPPVSMPPGYISMIPDDASE